MNVYQNSKIGFPFLRSGYRIREKPEIVLVRPFKEYCKIDVFQALLKTEK